MRHKRKRYGKSPVQTILPELLAMVHSGEVIISKQMHEELKKFAWEKPITIKNDSEESDEEILKGAMEQMKQGKPPSLWIVIAFVAIAWIVCFIIKGVWF